MGVISIVFLCAVAAVWLSSFGYLLLIGALALLRRRTGAPGGEMPEVAVVVPVRNEESYIAAKLEDLRRSDYPAERMAVVVVDGGSTDATTRIVERAIEQGAPVQLVRLDAARGKVDQLNHVFGRLAQEIVVATDVDTELDPSCIRELVRMLQGDPHTAVVGAMVVPRTALLEERIHWWLLNYLWWLEGEALSAAGVSGVCYAVRRAELGALPSDATAEDMCLAFLSAARGKRARLCRRARAVELRVPQDARQFVRFRRRRGGGYAREVTRAVELGRIRWGTRLAYRVRALHLFVTPKLAAVTAISGVALAWSAHWRWPLVVLGAFAVPLLGALSASTSLAGDAQRVGWLRLTVACARYVTLSWVALLTLDRRAPRAHTPAARPAQPHPVPGEPGVEIGEA